MGGLGLDKPEGDRKAGSMNAWRERRGYWRRVWGVVVDVEPESRKSVLESVDIVVGAN
jgi:hypothetical protein